MVYRPVITDLNLAVWCSEVVVGRQTKQTQRKLGDRMNVNRLSFCRIIVCVTVVLSTGHLLRAGSTQWIRQFGNTNCDFAYGVSSDGRGNAYVTGHFGDGLNWSIFGANPNARGGVDDGFLEKYDNTGALLWTSSVHTSQYDDCSAVSSDNLGNAYITGNTAGNLGGSNAGGDDAYVSKYDPNGNLIWCRQLGSTADDKGFSVTVDQSRNVYIGGYTLGAIGGPSSGKGNAFVAKYDESGNPIWTRQFGTLSVDAVFGIASDSHGNIYAAGRSDPWQPCLTKFDAFGNRIWTRVFGSVENTGEISDVAVDDSDNVVASGRNGLKGFITKYDPSGNVEWYDDTISQANSGVVVDRFGNVFTTGYVWGLSHDILVSKYNAAGQLIWTNYFGTVQSDSPKGIAADGLGSLFITGYTSSNLTRPPNGYTDAFIAKLSDVPEPGSLALITLGVAVLWMNRRHCNRQPHSGAMI
jgi:hypothetical protein